MANEFTGYRKCSFSFEDFIRNSMILFPGMKECCSACSTLFYCSVLNYIMLLCCIYVFYYIVLYYLVLHNVLLHYPF